MKPDLDLPEIAKAVALSFALLAAPAPAATLAYPLHLSAGWNLVATTDATTVENFAAAIGATGDIANVCSWDNIAKTWYFSSPALTANATLGDYNRSKGYKDFGAQSIGSGRGLWVDYRGHSRSALRYPLVDSAQAAFYNSGAEIAAPRAGQPLYGQDAQFTGNGPSYRLSDDGNTVTDQITQLTWMRAPNLTRTTPTAFDKKTLSEARAWVATVNAANYGGYADWRLPTIKELYSLINFKGSDPSGYLGSNSSALTPFIDTAYFNFSYGQPGLGERIIDSQYASSTMFVVNPDASGATKLFGVNFADGRIKGYDLSMPGGREKTFYVQLVRGASGYGVNAFKDNGDGTVSDAATGLMWSKG